MCQPTDDDADGGLTVWVAHDGLVSFVQQVVPHPPVEQLGLLDLARGRRLEFLGTGALFGVATNARCPQLFSGTRAPTADWPAWPGPGARHAR